MLRDRRSEPRTRVNYRVWLAFDDETALVPCRLIDISAGGARLQAPLPPVPDCFTMKFSETSGGSRFCLVTWRAGDEIGVQFMDTLRA